MEAITFIKLLTILGMFVIGLFPALLPMLVPLCCRSQQRNTSKSVHRHHAMQLSTRGKKVVSALACFGAGVFIATFFLDMIGEVRRSFDEWYASIYLNDPSDHLQLDAVRPRYPWPEFCAIMGFLLVLMMEQIIMYFHSRRHASVASNMRSRVAGSENLANGHNKQDKAELVRNGANMSENDSDAVFVRRSNETVILALGDPAVEQKMLGMALPLMQFNAAGGDAMHATQQQNAQSSEVSFHKDHHHEHTDIKSVMRAIILLLALCFHSVFEGMAVGLTPEQKDTVTLFAGVCMHKGIEAFCLGLNISQSGIRPFLVILFDVLFALMSPIGIAIGMAISDAPKTPTRYAVTAILQGLASGTFLYCTFIEILPKELLKDELAADHDHANVFLEDIAHQHPSPSPAADNSEHAAHAHAHTHNSREQADKLIKCLVFMLGIAVMAGAVALGDHFE